MVKLSAERLDEYRRNTFHLRDNLKLRSIEDALAFVDERGFVYFWPIKDIRLPSLWMAVAGNRPVADAHDDPGHVTWRWKDEALDKRRWYYAKVLRGRATMISLSVVPYFYALSENFGDPENDYLQLYSDGLLSREAKGIYEILLREGPLDTVTMRRKLHMTGKASGSPFDRGLVSLQRDFKILPVGISQAGGWRYSFIYDLVHRYYPELPISARLITRGAARRELVHLYLGSVGAASENEVQKLFQWPKRELDSALASLVDAGELLQDCLLEGQRGSCFAIPELA
ncbi:MAG: DNA glycosylase AlkZ-like family protein [Candidatus Promineifilaceae bacterium]